METDIKDDDIIIYPSEPIIHRITIKEVQDLEKKRLLEKLSKEFLYSNENWHNFEISDRLDNILLDDDY